MTERAEVLVIGVGGCGSSALYQLAKRGVGAIGIDRYEPGHARGSSHGETRVIRQAYFEHPDYVPLLERAYRLWEELESESGERLLELCGLLLAGPPDGEIMRGARLAHRRYGAPLEAVSILERRARFASLTVPEHFESAWEPRGGFLHVERCVRAYARLASRHGAQIRSGECVQEWSASERGVQVVTDHDCYEADALILCPGAWAPELLPDLASAAQMKVLRKVLLWYPQRHARAALPDFSFFFELPYGGFYGFPSLDGTSLKLAEHSGGEALSDPLALDRRLHPQDIAGPDRFVREVLRELAPSPLRHAACMYTMSADAHFVVDLHPEHSNVAIAAGFSGHGYKFMSVMGEILADLVIDGATSSPIDFLRFSRFSETS